MNADSSIGNLLAFLDKESGNIVSDPISRDISGSKRYKEDETMTTLFRRALGFVATIVMGLILASCGGGGDGGDAPPPPTYSLWIASPTDAGTYQTEDTTVSLSGSSFVPTGASCTGIVGTLPAGYQVTAYNAANGVSAYTTFYLGCLLQVNVIWHTAPIPLVLGSNTITVTATDSSGNTAHDTIVVTRVAETTPPTVVSTAPIAGATDVAVNAAVTVTFSEAMDVATINPATITLKDSQNSPVAASVSYDATNRQARLTPSIQLAYSATYTATVSTGVHDASGNALAADYAFSLTTGASNDFVAPVVQSVSPASGSTCAAASGAVTASFDEDIDPATVNGGSFSLTGPGNSAVSGTVAYLNRTASFTPGSALLEGSTYTAGLTTAIADLAGNHLASPYQWTFTTATGAGVGSWLPTSTSGVPSARYGHAAVWAGSEMIVTGGLAWDPVLNQYLHTGQYGRYNPTTETWKTAEGAPAAGYQTAFWTGSHMLVWGGSGPAGPVTAGARYDPTADAWTPMATTGQPSPRYGYAAVWTGEEMIIWGGNDNGTLQANGARYDRDTDTWQAMSTANAPSARFYHTAVWTGTEMIVWGGVGSTGMFLGDGARYNPRTDTWTPISNVGAPSARWGHAAAWSGTRMFIWGEMNGNTNTGGLYNPATNSWTPTDGLCAPSGRRPGNIVWTGSRMIVWGGATPSGPLDDGSEYDPVANIWNRITSTGSPSARSEHTAVWTGSKVIYWGGSGYGTELNTGGVLTP